MEVNLGLCCCALVLLMAAFCVLDYSRDRGWLCLRRRSVSGKLVVITGAAGGIGRAMALEFARRGAVLALWDVRAQALQHLVPVLVWITSAEANRVDTLCGEGSRDLVAYMAGALDQVDNEDMIPDSFATVRPQPCVPFARCVHFVNRFPSSKVKVEM